MNIHISENPVDLGKKAATLTAELIRKAINKKGSANIILATGTSQFQTLQHLVNEEKVDWSKVVVFHLDEYIGLTVTHPASFRKYLMERVIQKIPSLQSVHLINGETDADEECRRLGTIISQDPIDIALVGIGENGHLAFNDPPADFETELPYIVVNLDDSCRKQQFNEGWFTSINDVPKQAISMSVQQILKAEHIICSVPDSRKAVAVRNTVQQPISNLYPASILQRHSNCELLLDNESAALLSANFG